MKKKIVKLKNGITVISHKLNNTHSVTISVSFKVGSLYEDKTNIGITHLIEHLFFRQWDNLPQKRLYYEMQCMGAEILGKTFPEYVSFIITVSPDFFLDAFKLIIKCINDFNWSDDIVRMEKRIVLRQIENDYQSYEKWIDSYYLRNTNYEKPIMGTAESLQSLSTNDINLWKSQYFCSRNSCVIVTGNYSDEDFLKAQNILCDIKALGCYSDSILCQPLNFENRNYRNRYFLESVDSEKSDITVFFDINSNYDYETVRLISSILGEGCGSLLSMNLRETHGFTDDIYTALKCFSGFYRISISFNVDNSDFLKSIRYFFETLEYLKNKLSEDDYLTSINFFTKNQLFDLDNPNALNSNYVFCDFVLNRALISEPLQAKEKYAKVTVNDLKKCAGDIFVSKNLSFLFQTKLDKKIVKNSIEEMIYNYL